MHLLDIIKNSITSGGIVCDNTDDELGGHSSYDNAFKKTELGQRKEDEGQVSAHRRGAGDKTLPCRKLMRKSCNPYWKERGGGRMTEGGGDNWGRCEKKRGPLLLRPYVSG